VETKCACVVVEQQGQVQTVDGVVLVMVFLTSPPIIIGMEFIIARL